MDMDRLSRRIRTLIVDDEPLARETLRLLMRDDPDLELLGECCHGGEAVESIRNLKPDLVFLDVQMPVLDGFQTLEALKPDPMPVVVFVTAYDQYALRAFDAYALDYLLKPFDDDRFERALERAKTRIRQAQTSALSEQILQLLQGFPLPGQPRAPLPSRPDVSARPVSPAQPQSRSSGPAAVSRGPEPGQSSPEGEAERDAAEGAFDPDQPAAPGASRGAPIRRIAIKNDGRIFFVKVEDIDYIEATDYYVTLHVGGKSHLLRESLRALEVRLDPSLFLRIHRSTVVNLDRVVRLEPYSHGEYMVVMKDGTQLKLSRSYREQLHERLSGNIAR